MSRWRAAAAFVGALLLAGCANGDFGRVKSGLVWDGIHDWMGPAAMSNVGLPASTYPLTDDERRLRDLAFPLIQPAYERNRWFSILEEYGVTHNVLSEWCVFNVAAYEQILMQTAYRSATARYARLNEDIRNDIVRLPGYVAVARRVLDMDIKRNKSLPHVSALTPGEAASANARMAENALIMSWVQQSLANRAASYAFALERLVIATPVPMAVEVERSLMLFKARMTEGRVLPGPEIKPGTIVFVAPYPPPPVAPRSSPVPMSAAPVPVPHLASAAPF